MRRLAEIFLLTVLCVLDAAAQLDTAKLAQLDSRLEQYFSILEQEPFEVKNEECDALIGAAGDPALRQTVALKIYDHYRSSKLMGDEAVAIHLVDRWFAGGDIPMRSDRELFEAKMFADFNRQSLLGHKAPQMELQTPYGETFTVPEPVEVGYSILYFFDTDCAKCKLETAMLRSLLDDKEYPVTVYAVYVGSDEAGWKRWRESTFTLSTEETRVEYLWDPDGTADLQFKYGVVQTPRMFLTDPEWTIIGRGLDTGSLEQMLDGLLDDGEYSYGSEASKALFDKLFSTYGERVGAADVTDVARLLEERTLGQGDTLSFKHLEGDLLYYLASRREEGFKEGSAAFMDGYILSRPDIWNTSDDSLMVVGMAGMMRDLLAKTPVGSRIPRMGIKGWNRFRRQGGYMFFHSEGCPICEAEMAQADLHGIKYFSVNMDALEEKSPAKARKLLETFDLSGLPLAILIGKGGKVERRYVSLTEQLSFLDEKD